MYEDELDLDNQEYELESDEQELEDEQAGQEPGEEEDPPEKKGNLSKALQEERRERRELKQRLERAEAMLERVGQGRESRQPSRDEIDQQRAQLQDLMLNRPDDFTNIMESRIAARIRQEYAPVMAIQAERIISGNQEHKALYDVPEIREVVDNFVQNEIQNGGIQDQKDLKEVLGNVMDAVKKIRGAGAVTGSNKNPNLNKMTSIANKGGGGNRKSGEERFKELQTLAKSNPKKYVEEMQKPENRRVVNELAFKKPT